MITKETDRQHLSSVQYASADNLHARFGLYDLAIPKENIYETGMEHLHLKGDEHILEVGCGDGSALMNVRRKGHTGKMVGVDISEGMFAQSVHSQKQEHLDHPIEFIVGSADALPFEDGSFDVILAFFMLYHMPDIQKTLREWSRLLKDGGNALVATSSGGNKAKLRAFKKRMGEIVGSTTFPHMSSSFRMENGKAQLSTVFSVTDTYIYEGKIRLSDPELCLRSIRSTRDLCEPMPSDEKWAEAEGVIRREIEREIAEQGYFEDDVRRGFFVCEKKDN